MLESETYRNQLADITKFFTDENGTTKRLLKSTDVGRYLGIHHQTAKKTFDINKPGITIIELARKLSAS